MIRDRSVPLLSTAVLCAALPAGPCFAVDFFWSATAQTFGWFDRETPEGPPGFSPWTLGGGGISGEAPDDAADRAFLSTAGKTTTLGSSVTVELVTITGDNAVLQMNGGFLTTVTGLSIPTASAELAFTAGTINNSTGGLTNLGTIRGLSGIGTITGDVDSSGQVIVGNAATLNFNGTNATFSQTAGSFDVVAGGTTNFNSSGYNFDLTGGTMDIDGTMNFNSGPTFTLNGGTLNSPGTFNINANGTFNHISGAMTGEVRMAGGNLNLLTALATPAAALGSPTFRIVGNGAITGNIHEAATVIVDNPSGNVTLTGGATTIENRGEVALTSSTFSGSSGLGFQPTGGLDNNGGTVRAAFGAGTSTQRLLTSAGGGGGAVLTNRNGGQLIVEPGIDLTLRMDVDNTSDIDVGVGASVLAASASTIHMNGGTLNNDGSIYIDGSTFRYAGGTITGNAIEFDGGLLIMDGGTGPATFHFLATNVNQLQGDIAAGQTLVVDAVLGFTNVRQGSNINADNSFTNGGTIRLTGSDVNDAAQFFVPGSQSVVTHTGLLHAQGVPGSSNLRRTTATNGAQLINSGQITVDPDTTLELGIAVVNTGDVTIGTGGTLDMDTANASAGFTHNAGTITNNGSFLLGGSDNFTFNGGTIAGNPIALNDATLTLAPGTGPASFIMQRGTIDGDINAGQTVEVQNNLTSIQITDTPGDMTNHGTLIHGGNGGGLGANIFRLGGLFQNLTLTNNGQYVARNDNASLLGGFRTINGALDNHGIATIEPFVTYRALNTINRGGFTIQPDGVVQLTGGYTFTQQDGELANNGTFDLGGGVFNYNGGDVTGNTIIADGQLFFAPGLNGGGDFVMNNNGNFAGEVPQQASVRFVGPATSAWVVGPGASPDPTTNHGRIILDNSLGGFVDLRAQGTHTITPTGRLEGDGRISFQAAPATLINNGTLAPGDPNADRTGTLRVSGMVQTTGTLDFEIGGTADQDFDRLTATSAITLGGTLNLTLIPGFTPAPGDSFDIITATSITGVFDSSPVVALSSTQAGLIAYAADTVSVVIALVGDTDMDGDIDDSDLGTSFSNYTGPVGVLGGKTFAQGDMDGDGDVDDSDLGSSFSNYTGPIAVNVPEPASLALFVLGGLLATRRRR